MNAYARLSGSSFVKIAWPQQKKFIQNLFLNLS